MCIHYLHNICICRAPSAGSSVARVPCNDSYCSAVASSNDPAATRCSAHPIVWTCRASRVPCGSSHTNLGTTAADDSDGGSCDRCHCGHRHYPGCSQTDHQATGHDTYKNRTCTFSEYRYHFWLKVKLSVYTLSRHGPGVEGQLPSFVTSALDWGEWISSHRRPIE
jgi:hypothetical protein